MYTYYIFKDKGEGFLGVYDVYIYITYKCILTTYSKTKVRVSLVCMMSCRVTILACFSPRRREATKGRKKSVQPTL